MFLSKLRILTIVLSFFALPVVAGQSSSDELKDLLSSIEKEYSVRLDMNNFEFVPETKGVDDLAFCRIENKKIVISRKYWNNMKVPAKTALLIHEIGHCYFNKGHVITTRTLSDGCHVSLMVPELKLSTLSQCYTKHKEFYRSLILSPGGERIK